MTGSSEMYQANRASGSVNSNDVFLSPTDAQNYDISTPVRPDFLPKQLSFTSEQQREMDGIIASLEQQDEQRINEIKKIAITDLARSSDKWVRELLAKRQSVTQQEPAAGADPVYSSALGGASSSSGPVEQPTYQLTKDELSDKSLEYLQTTYEFLYQRKTKMTDREKLIDKILEYKLDMSPETKKWLKQQELIAKGVSKGKPKNTKK
jgi:hypothetical protein